MTRDRDPEAEKRRDYDNQFRDAYGESRHAERKNRPLRRARTHRAARRAVHQALGDHGGVDDWIDADRVEGAVADVRLGELVIGTTDLRSRIADRNHYRAAEAGRKFFRETYDSERHREPFTRFLRAVVAGAAPQVDLARRFHRLLHDEDGGRDQEFLDRFLADDPSWRRRLRRWCERALAPRTKK